MKLQSWQSLVPARSPANNHEGDAAIAVQAMYEYLQYLVRA